MSDASDLSSPPGVERLLALSDGVVAIALTLLVLQLEVPAGLRHPDSARQLAHALTRINPQIVSYLVSFYVIGQFWLVHHRVFRLIGGHSEGLAWWNFGFLLTITLMPFTSRLLGVYSDNPLAVDIFAVNLLVASLATQGVLVFARRRGLLAPDVTEADTRAGRARVVGMFMVLGSSVIVAWVSTSAAMYMWLLLVAVGPLSRRWTARRGSEEAVVATEGAGP